MSSLEEDRLKELIVSLQLAHKMGFSSSSSAIVPLLEAAIDCSLLISSLLKEGSTGPNLNPEVKFLYNEKPDALGNTRSIKIFPEKKFYWNPRAEKILTQFTSFLILVKNQAPIPDRFMRLVDDVFPDKPTKVGSKIKNTKKKQKSLKHKNSAYYRRQRQKKTN
jgi:hypothetical protein